MGHFVHAAGMSHGVRCSVSCAEVARNKSEEGAWEQTRGDAAWGELGRQGGCTSRRLPVALGTSPARQLLCWSLSPSAGECGIRKRKLQCLCAGGGRVCQVTRATAALRAL